MSNIARNIYAKALEAMSERFHGDEPPHWGPLWAEAIWWTRRFVPRSWIPG